MLLLRFPFPAEGGHLHPRPHITWRSCVPSVISRRCSAGQPRYVIHLSCTSQPQLPAFGRFVHLTMLVLRLAAHASALIDTAQPGDSLPMRLCWVSWHFSFDLHNTYKEACMRLLAVCGAAMRYLYVFECHEAINTLERLPSQHVSMLPRRGRPGCHARLPPPSLSSACRSHSASALLPLIPLQFAAADTVGEGQARAGLFRACRLHRGTAQR